MSDLSNRVAIITGSARGIGLAIAQKLAERGATVVINDLDPGRVEQAVAELQARGGKGSGIAADIRDPEGVQRLVDGALAAYQRLDILVNNAGIARDALLLRMSESEWDEVLSTNLRAAFLCTRAALRPMLRQRWGRLINIASVVGLVGNAGQANYAASKAGLAAFTKAVAREVASRGITANAIAPGFIDTDMTRRLSEEQRQALLRQIPMGAFGSPEDVAEAVAFLASEGARYITGHILLVDGGMVMA